MNLSDERQLENLLGAAPRPRPPEGLKDSLLMQARPARPVYRPFAPAHRNVNWLRRWWPALMPAGFSLACAAVVAIQQNEIRDLEQSVKTLTVAAQQANVSAPDRLSAKAAAADALAAQQLEIARLKEQVESLSAEIAQLEKVRAENRSLQAKLAAPPPRGFSPEETSGMEAARQRALKINCMNNMKQLALAARLWALDNDDRFPTDIICMSNEINTPKILVCPADTARQVARDFSSLSDANCSYEWLLNPQGSDAEPSRVMTRCAIHGHVGLYDGSVQTLDTNHPEWLVRRDGKLYYEPRPAASH